MRKTKIVCTLGPATDQPGVLEAMIKAGMNVARFNFSHGTHEDHGRRLAELKTLRDQLGVPVAAMLDTKGPEVRLKDFEGGSAEVKDGMLFTLSTNERIGDETGCTVSYKGLPGDVSVGDRVLIDDGNIIMRILEITGNDILCHVENGGVLKNHKSVNVPDAHLSMPYMSDADRADIRFGIEQGFDFLACSFVQSAANILDVRQFLDYNGCERMKIISKIENGEGVQNLDEIIAVSDAIMVARGDMGVELDFAEVPAIQKRMILACYNAGKPVITATQMLESMMEEPRPTRAEAADVANAIYDGTSAVMLSGETAAGKFPVLAVETMATIAERTENHINYGERFLERPSSFHLSVSDALAHAACATALDIGAKLLIASSKSGETSRLMSKYRPPMPILGCVTDSFVYRVLSLSWGVIPLILPHAQDTESLFSSAMDTAEEAGLVRDGDFVVMTAGSPVGTTGSTNIMKADVIGKALASGIGIGKSLASGRVCVCHGHGDAERDFKEGDVLVASWTPEEMLPFMRAASAIVTEEGGLNSHAAIIGMTLDIPVIVSVAGATSKLKTGQYVVVDAERGIVRPEPEL